MKPDFVQRLRCPARDCNHERLTLQAAEVATLRYGSETVQEVKSGSLDCPACSRRYPIESFVPSFESLFPEELLSEADYWGKWYGFMWERGYLGFFDLRAPMAPLITEGIEALDPSSLDRKDLGGSHSLINAHPAIKDAEWLLDVGCGTGWSSLYFARQGHKVVGFDPSAANMRLAKRYAIAQGYYVEYIGTGLGFLSFHPEVFDAVVALHSIHHVPNLREEMAILRAWMRPGAGIGIDEHIRNNELLTVMAHAMREWAEREVYTGARTLPEDALAGLPRAEPSAMEGAGSESVIEAFLDNFPVESFESRYVTLDPFSFIYYLSRGGDYSAYNYAGDVIQHLYRFLLDVYPNGAEYVTLIGRNTHPETGAGNGQSNDLAKRARLLAAGDEGPAGRRIAALQHELSGAYAALDELRATVDSLNGTAAALRGYLETSNNAAGELRGHVDSLNAAVTELRGTVEDQNTLIKSQGNEIARLEAALAARDRHIDEIKKWAQSLERDLKRAGQRSLTGRARAILGRITTRRKR
jgi:SAM-dependent methyltransferase